MRASILAGALVVGMAFTSSQAANLTNGVLAVEIREDNGAIDAVIFSGSDFYDQGTHVSDYGFQNGVSTGTFSRLTTSGGIGGPVSITSVSTLVDSVVVVGRYTGGGASVGFTRTYSLVAGTDALKVQIELTNLGLSPVSIRWYETFDPDQGNQRGLGFFTFNDVFEIVPGVRVGQATDSGGLSVVMGSPDLGSVVASGDPFQIDSGSVLNEFFSNPFDGNGAFDDSGTHVGAPRELAPGSSATFVYHQAYGRDQESARSAFLAALASTRCFVIDAIDDQFTVINDGTTSGFPVLTNEECRADTPISVVIGDGDLIPDRGGSAITDGTTVSYAPAAGFVGLETFTYTAQDAGLEGGNDPPTVDRDTATISVLVLEDLAPDAVDDAATTLQDQPLVVDVLANDALGNGPTEVVLEIEAKSGTAMVQADATIRYVPNFNFFGEDTFVYRLTDANGDSDVATVVVGVFFVRGQVLIDIMPSDAGNNLNLRAGPGAGFEVAILSAGEFFQAPERVDPLTLKLGPRQANIWGSPRVRDVDGDGDDDLLVKFLTQQTGIACGDTQASLSGRTVDFGAISGTDAINTFNCPRVRKRY